MCSRGRRGRGRGEIGARCEFVRCIGGLVRMRRRCSLSQTHTPAAVAAVARGSGSNLPEIDVLAGGDLRGHPRPRRQGRGSSGRASRGRSTRARDRSCTHSSGFCIDSLIASGRTTVSQCALVRRAHGLAGRRGALTTGGLHRGRREEGGWRGRAETLDNGDVSAAVDLHQPLSLQHSLSLSLCWQPQWSPLQPFQPTPVAPLQTVAALALLSGAETLRDRHCLSWHSSSTLLHSCCVVSA